MKKEKTVGAKAAKTIPVLVTTEYRGVFFGYADKSKIGEKSIDLKAAQLCVYWSADVQGFMGLAANGPSKNCRIGPPADIKLHGVTAVASVTPKAVENWTSQPWSTK